MQAQAQPAEAARQSGERPKPGRGDSGVEMKSRRNSTLSQHNSIMLASDKDKYTALNVDMNDFVGLEITVPDRKKRLAAADWLCAASIAHKKKYITLVDHEERDLEFYKTMRREACRRFFYASVAGLLLAIWANEVMHSHGRKNSFQSLSLQITMVCSSGLAIYFLCDFYYAELCVARLKGWKLAPGFCPRALKGANLWNQFLRDLLIMVPQPLPFLFFTFTVHDAGMDRDSTYPVSVVLLSLMFLRIYFIPRFHSYCIDDLHTHRHDVFFSLNKTLLDDSFLLKSTMTTSLSAVIGMFAMQIVLYSYMLMMFERATSEGPLQNFTNSVWLVIVTMTTVGYGDIFPTTRLGRLVAVSASFSALIMIAICINIVQSSLEMSRADRKVVEKNERRSLIRETRMSAGKLILASLRVQHERFKERDEPPQQEPVDFQELSKEFPPPFAGQPDGGDDGPLSENKVEEVELEGIAGTLQEWGVIPRKPVVIGPVQKEQEMPGGGRGRPKTTVIYGKQLSLGVLLAEEAWHLALRDFRGKQRCAYMSDVEASTDVLTMLHEIGSRLYESESVLDETEMKIRETHHMLRVMVEEAEAAASKK